MLSRLSLGRMVLACIFRVEMYSLTTEFRPPAMATGAWLLKCLLVLDSQPPMNMLVKKVFSIQVGAVF